jgi:hypothetical protein
MDSDRFLQKVIIKQKLLTIYSKKAPRSKKWNKTNLQNSIKFEQYRRQLYNRFKSTAEQQEQNEEWGKCKSTIIDSSKKKSITIKVSKNESWDEEYRQTMKQENM